MASIRKVGEKWRVEVRRKGVYDSETFSTKAEATRWGVEREAEIEDGRRGKLPRKTLRDALTRYAEEVTTHKRGWRAEGIRINKFLATVPFVDRLLVDITPDDWGTWRDGLARGSADRKPLAAGSIIRDFNIIRSVYSTATTEWGWLKTNPMPSVKNPPKPRGRDKIISPAEVAAICKALGYADGAKPATQSQRTALGFLFALETGMRAGEVFGLLRDKVDAERRVAHLPLTKNGSPRDVPLSRRALELLALADGVELVFGLTAKQADALFRKYRPATCAHVHFHDARHTAATRLGASGKLTPLELCRMFGWTRMDQALAYFNASASSIASKLD